MADGLKNIAAPDLEVKIGKKSYRLTPMTPVTLGEIEDHVITLRANPIAMAKKVLGSFTPDEQQSIMQMAIEATTQMNVKASQEEVELFLNSVDGVCFTLWTMLRENHPEIADASAVKDILAGLQPVDMMQLQEDMKRASGMGALGNSPCQATDVVDLPVV